MGNKQKIYARNRIKFERKIYRLTTDNNEVTKCVKTLLTKTQIDRQKKKKKIYDMYEIHYNCYRD